MWKNRLKCMRGFSLVEVLVALALLSALGVGLLSTLGDATRVLSKADDRETARDLAQAQMEYIQQQEMIDPATYEQMPEMDTRYPGFSIDTPMASWINGDGSPGASDTAFQNITIVVRKDGQSLFTLEGRKVLMVAPVVGP